MNDRKKHRPSFRHVFWRFLSVAIDGRRWRTEERFRNSYMHSLRPHIHRRFSFVSRRSSTNERRFQITFCIKPRPAVYLPGFFVERLSFRYKEKKILSDDIFENIYYKVLHKIYIRNCYSIVLLILDTDGIQVNLLSCLIESCSGLL